jgi:hypothetical protein
MRDNKTNKSWTTEVLGASILEERWRMEESNIKMKEEQRYR